jgi:carbon monoxide dehydrogenase subunit G
MHVRAQFAVAAPAARVWKELSDPASIAAAIGGDDLTKLDGGAGFTGALRRDLTTPAIDAIVTLRPIDTDEDGRTATCELQIRETTGPGVASGLMRSQVDDRGAQSLVSLSLEGRVAAPGLDQTIVERQVQNAIELIGAALERILSDRTTERMGAADDGQRSIVDRARERSATAAAISARVAVVALLAAVALVIRRLRRRRRSPS